MSKDKDNVLEIPELLETFYLPPAQTIQLWQMMKMFDWRFLPTEIMSQPEALMGDLLVINSTYETIKEMIKKKRVI